MKEAKGQSQQKTGLGLPPNQVWLCDYSPLWPTLFAQEETRLRDAVGEWIVGIEHVGSTSVAGLKAKPIIDILLGVKRFEAGLKLAPHLKPLGYRYLPRQVVKGHHVFAKGSAITHLLHVVEHLGPEWKRVVTFREFLRSRPDVAARYEADKARLSLAFATKRNEYSAAKEPIIDGILLDAAVKMEL